MEKNFYEEPEMEIQIYDLKNGVRTIVTDSNDGSGGWGEPF